jgi:hypothetical protein
MTCCNHGYGRPSWRPRVSDLAKYRSGTPRNQHPAVARWHAHLRGLATVIHEISGLDLQNHLRLPGCLNGQFDDHGGPRVFFADYPNLAAMIFDDFLAHRHVEASVTPVLGCERVEHVL